MTSKNSTTNRYQNPLNTRYSSNEMSYIFSPDFKFSTWRKLWIALAESQKELGLDISDEQINEMRANVDNIDYDEAKKQEALTRHDVMAHVHTFGIACPKAKPIIHLGATSAYVGDNTDLVQLKEAGILVLKRLTQLINALSDFAIKYKDLPTLGFTHFQPAQLTTVGKRATLWLLELSMDYENIENVVLNTSFRGVKGTTGTQASFLHLFNGNHEKVKKLDTLVTEKLGFKKVLPVTGQTYTRKIDANYAYALGGLAQTMHKISNDIRLLQNLKEIEEPFEKNQVGSSAMAYKRNPMRTERITSLSRYMLSLTTSPAMTASEQWFERTLDDSANKRLSIPEMFLAADAILVIGLNVCEGLVVYPKVIEKHVRSELPFMASENIIMEAVKRGGDRQELHERIRVHSMEAGKKVKMEGLENDLLDRVIADKVFGLTKEDIDKLLNLSDFIGRAPQQTEEFITNVIKPIITRGEKYGSIAKTTLNV